MQEERDYVILRTYENVWKTPFKIYSIENFKLWVPINPWELLYFLFGLVVVFVLGRVLPFINAIPFIIRYIAIPFGIMKFFTKIKLDGKQPHKFIFDFLVFKAGNKRLERFQAVNEIKRIKFTRVITFRDSEHESTKDIKKRTALNAKRQAKEHRKLLKQQKGRAAANV